MNGRRPIPVGPSTSTRPLESSHGPYRPASTSAPPPPPPPPTPPTWSRVGLELSVFLQQSFVPFMVPSDSEYHQKERARVYLERLTNQLYKGAKLLPFGSMANGFALSGCDMDLCCLVPDDQLANTNPVQFVTKLGQLIQQQTGFSVKVLDRARIPIIKLVLSDGLNCDIGFENRLALENTRLLLTYAMIDPRLRILVLLIKVWAKQRNINNPYRGTLSSYGFVLLVIHFLSQVKQPPVLPNLQQLANPTPTNTQHPSTTHTTTTTHPNNSLATATTTTTTTIHPNTSTPLNHPQHPPAPHVLDLDPSPPAATATATAGRQPSPERVETSPEGHNLTFFDDLDLLGQHWQGTNQDSSGQLAIEFFRYFATEYAYHDKVISIRSKQGQLDRQQKNWFQLESDQLPYGRDLHFLSIEDPFQLDYNVARTVTAEGLYTIRGEFLRAYRILSSSPSGEPIVNLVNELLAPDSQPIPTPTYYPPSYSQPHPHSHPHPHPHPQPPSHPPRRRSAPSPRIPNPAVANSPPYDLHRFFQSPSSSSLACQTPAPIFPERDRQAVALANEITFGNFSPRSTNQSVVDSHRKRGRSVPHFRLDKDGEASILFGEIKVVIPTYD